MKKVVVVVRTGRGGGGVVRKKEEESGKRKQTTCGLSTNNRAITRIVCFQEEKGIGCYQLAEPIYLSRCGRTPGWLPNWLAGRPRLAESAAGGAPIAQLTAPPPTPTPTHAHH